MTSAVSNLLVVLLGTSCADYVSSFLPAASPRSLRRLFLGLDYENDDSGARSQFGTKEYWDDMYLGFGDFDKDEYEWYFGWSEIKSFFQDHVPIPGDGETTKLLIPGMGNDPILLDLVGAGYRDITAFDYSEGAVERQSELLSYDSSAKETVTLLCRDARALDEEWTNEFDAILEKGCLDALYLSDETDGNVERAAEELHRVLKPGGVFMSVSGVVPAELRREIISIEKYDWIRDGTDDLKAGCFVWRKR
jgi:SAM-dependent methyltransferase